MVNFSNFLKVISSIFDFSSTINRTIISDNPWKNDADAIASDWSSVGSDICYAMIAHGKEDKKEKCNF